MQRFLTSLMALATVLVVGAAPASGTSPSTPAKARPFSATGIISRDYTRQTVTGVYNNAKGRPLNVTVYDWHNNVLVFAAKPKLDTSYAGGYWHQTYGFDQWYVGQDTNAVFHFMLPPRPMGSTFVALLVTDFKGGGNWQNWMDGTSG